MAATGPSLRSATQKFFDTYVKKFLKEHPELRRRFDLHDNSQSVRHCDGEVGRGGHHGGLGSAHGQGTGRGCMRQKHGARAG